MPFQPEGLDSRTLKRLAQRLRKGFSEQFPTTPCAPHQAQALLATMLGHPSWHAALKASNLERSASASASGPVPKAMPPAAPSFAALISGIDRHALPGHVWLEQLSAYLVEHTVHDHFYIAGEMCSQVPDEWSVFSPDGLLSIFLVRLLDRQREFPNQELIAFMANESALMNIVPMVNVEKLPSAWTSRSVGKVGQDIVARLHAQRDEQGKIDLDPWYDQFYTAFQEKRWTIYPSPHGC